MVDIDKNVPMPTSRTGGIPEEYRFAEMEVGDSILVPEGTTKGAVYSAAQQWGNRFGKRFIGRQREGGLRIWRAE